MRLRLNDSRIIALVLFAAIALAGGLAFRHRADVREAFIRRAGGPVPGVVSRSELFGADGDMSDDGASLDVVASLPAVAGGSRPPAGTTPPTHPENVGDTNGDTGSEAAPPAPTDALPAQLNLHVPFVSQAPHGVWDAIHDDACEEATLIMLNAYLTDVQSVSVDEAEAQIQALVAKQMEMFGYFESTDAEQVVALARTFYGLDNLAVVPLNHIDDLKRELARGYPVIIPADGKALRNPFFRGDGPTYHMFVAKGYTSTHIITNEPGTRRGADYPYTYATIMAATRDWNGGDVKNGQRVMIVVR